ncbi:hypothetical protein TBLA_0E01530 [Henningerozyma blattae CBS 6284]|uniref:Nitrogen permease regulator 3 n=1 Tax=Henningerozyma blattae (strain ATCC 34711 / CBS 6284 / DSM 70876 / NBRC 10599 / NRRL Y-10934 / UCD 77-7) TaxID=1071380 RepID=I2H4A8_HENB6|nr:hypothetical protein TBLA_0E01530 [Tetrapisispora blattae CBS 6284]CCH61210.1 hypothetical protein TBLA_0E01530 [Tetrapisispora blattae CBS 6284]
MQQCIPNSRLLGIQLTISTHSGPQIVYNYPPAISDYKSIITNNIPTDIKKFHSNIRNSTSNQPSPIDPFLKNSKNHRHIFTPQDELNMNSFNMSTSSITRDVFSVNVRSARESDTDQDSMADISDSELTTDYCGTDSTLSESSSSDTDSVSVISVKSNSNLNNNNTNLEKNDKNIQKTISNLINNRYNQNTNNTYSQQEQDDEYADDEGDDEISANLKNIKLNSNELTDLKKSHSNQLNTNDFKSDTSGSTILKTKTPTSNTTIAATKLLDIINQENSNRKISLSSKLLLSTDDDIDRVDSGEYVSDQELATFWEKEDFKFIERYFEEDVFQDLSKIFDFDSEFVAEFCSPEREMCNTKFEFTIDKFCFLGLPIHVDEEGNWKKSKKKKHSSRSKRSSSIGTKCSVNNHSTTANTNTDITRRRENSDLTPFISDTTEKDLVTKLNDTISVESYDESGKDDLQNNMTMFHVVFIMDPSLIEYNQRVNDMFRNVAARLSLFLRSAQAKTSYVSRECDIMLKEKESIMKTSRTYRMLKGPRNKTKYLYKKLLTKSSLARALTVCVDSLQKNEIASLQMNDEKFISLQIPIHYELKFLPRFKLDPVLKGTFLTSILNSKFLARSSSLDQLNATTNQINYPTSNSNNANENEYDTFFDDDNNLLDYALLPLDEPSNIIKKLETSSNQDDLTSVLLIHIVRHIQPTLPLRSYQYLIDDVFRFNSNEFGMKELENGESIKINLLKSCTLHLLYWRYVRVIIPISSRNTYIISPLSPIQGSNKDLLITNKNCLKSYNDYNNKDNNENNNNNDRYHSNKSTDSKVENKKPLIYQYQDMFKETFPSLPILPLFLNLLSNGKPKPYGIIIPSKDHKPIYLKALSWLLRNGFVYQQLTFICIRVDKQVKMQVEEDLEREGFKNSNKNVNNVSTGGIANHVTSTNTTTNIPNKNDDNINSSLKDAVINNRGINKNHGNISKTTSNNKDNSNNEEDNMIDDNDDIRIERSTFTNNNSNDNDNNNNHINLRLNLPYNDIDKELAYADASSKLQNLEFEEDMNNFDYGDPKMEKDYTIILEPERASALEKRWIYKCIQDQPSDIQMIFNKLLKYFNGRTPMEVVILRENVSRHDIKKLMKNMHKYLMEYHHW